MSYAKNQVHTSLVLAIKTSEKLKTVLSSIFTKSSILLVIKLEVLCNNFIKEIAISKDVEAGTKVPQ